MKTLILALALAVTVTAQVTIPGGPHYFPALNPLAAPTTSGATCAISAAAHYCEWVVAIPKSGDITKIALVSGGVTTNLSGTERLSVSLETLTAGNASGTNYKGSAAGTLASIAAATAYEITLGTQATSAVYADAVAVKAIVTNWSAASFTLSMGSSAINGSFPYFGRSTDSGSTWTKSTGAPKVAFVYSDGTIGMDPGALPPCVSTSTTLNNSAATYDIYGSTLTLPFSASVSSAYTMASAATTSSSGTLHLANAAHSDVTSATFAAAENVGASTGVRIGRFAPVVLTANVPYEVTLEATSASANNTTLFSWDCLSTAYITAFSGGTNSYVTRRARSGGAWSTVTTSKVSFGVLIDSIYIGGSSAYVAWQNGKGLQSLADLFLSGYRPKIKEGR